MLISFHASPLSQWQQKQIVLEQLYDIANQPLTAPKNIGLSLQQRINDLIYDENFDSLFGGILVSVKKNSDIFYFKPLITNLYLSEILIAADQVFYQGDLSFIGNQILENIFQKLTCNSLLEPSNLLIKSRQYFYKEELDCFFNGKVLNEQLIDKELLLLSALTKKNINDGCLLSFSCSLRDAADSINMHYKEAQILEYNIKEKLNSTVENSIPVKSEKVSDLVGLNCQIIISISSMIACTKNKKPLCLIKNLFNELYHIRDEGRFSTIEIIYAGIYLLQADFDAEIFYKIDLLLSDINIDLIVVEDNDKRALQIKTIVKFFIKLLDENVLIMKNYAVIEALSKINHCLKEVDVVFLSKEQIDLDTRLIKLRSKFNPYQLIYIT